MKTHIAPLAVLAAQQNTHIGIAVLSMNAADDGWYQLLPADRFRARDGRPFDIAEGWLMTAAIAARLIAQVRALGQDILIDYEHNQLRKKEGLTPDALSAAGWFNADEMQWREGAGLFVKPRWTAAAQTRVDGGEYRFLSAVFPYNELGEPTELRMAALTNDPGVTGMQALAALAAEFSPTPATQESKPMNEILRQLLAKLGITVPENAQPTEAQATAALSAVVELQTKAGTADSLQTQVTALSAEVETAKTAQPGTVDLTKYVPRDTYDALRTNFVALSADHSTATLTQVLDDAENDGRIFKSERSYFEQVGGQIGVAALSAQLQGKQPIAALNIMQTKTVDTPAPKVAALSAEDLQTCRLLGMTEDEFRKAKEEDAK